MVYNFRRRALMSSGNDDEPWRPRLLGFIEEFDDWLALLPGSHVVAIEAHLRAKLRRRHQAPSLDERIFHTFVRIERSAVWGYLFDDEITETAVIVLVEPS